MHLPYGPASGGPGGVLKGGEAGHYPSLALMFPRLLVQALGVGCGHASREGRVHM